MKKILLLILISFAAQSQTLIKLKQLENATAGSVITTTGSGTPTWTNTLPVGVIPSLPYIPTSSVSAFQPTVSGGYWRVNGNTITGNGSVLGSSSTPVNTSTASVLRLGLNSTSWFDFGDGGAGSTYVWAHRNTSKSTSNYNLFIDELDCLINDSSSVQLRLNNSNAFSVVNPVRLKTNSDFCVIYPISFQKTNLQESRSFRLLARTQGFLLGGTLATQRVALFEATTYTAAVAATLTNVYNSWFSKGIASTSVSIGNNWGIGTDGSAHITESVVIGSSAHTPSATLDVTGTGLFTSSVSIGGVKAAVLSDALFSLQFSTSFFSPADATTYYIGQMTDVSGTNALNSVVYVPYNCTLVGWSYSGRVQTTPSTAETSTISVRVNNTTDILLSSTITNSLASGFNNFRGTVSSNLTADDFINIKWLTPSWATNPTNVATGVTLWFVRRQ